MFYKVQYISMYNLLYESILSFESIFLLWTLVTNSIDINNVWNKVLMYLDWEKQTIHNLTSFVDTTQHDQNTNEKNNCDKQDHSFNVDSINLSLHRNCSSCCNSIRFIGMCVVYIFLISSFFIVSGYCSVDIERTQQLFTRGRMSFQFLLNTMNYSRKNRQF